MNTTGPPQSEECVFTKTGSHQSANRKYSTAHLEESGDRVYTTDSPAETERWLLLADQMDQSCKRAVIIKNKHTGRFLAVQEGRFVGLMSYTEDCKWFLE